MPTLTVREIPGLGQVRVWSLLLWRPIPNGAGPLFPASELPSDLCWGGGVKRRKGGKRGTGKEGKERWEREEEKRGREKRGKERKRN